MSGALLGLLALIVGVSLGVTVMAALIAGERGCRPPRS